VTVEAEAKTDAVPGAYTVAIGGVTGTSAFTVYRQVDSVQIQPAHAIARVGGNGGSTPPIPAQFEAVGYLNGPDGKSGTVDDIRIGVLPATWDTDNYNEEAEKMHDAAFTGEIDSRQGFFMPREAGPNPQRRYSTNNAGDLAVTAKVQEGKGRLIVTVQRWVDPPVR
jgi:quinohemoprotein amine dehydrogenase